MVNTLRFHTKVPADLRNALQWYESISPELASQFRIRVNEAWDRIAAQPLASPLAFDNIRFCRLEQFPYIILFQPQANQILVIGVFHGASDPTMWSERA
jgi:plasmid stabilization system protein ParE